MHRSRCGFTLIEMLVVVVIVLVLLGLLLPVICHGLRRAKETQTELSIADLALSLSNYRMSHQGEYPIVPGGNALLRDDGSGPYTPPDFFQVDCAPAGSASSGTEDNAPLIKFLHETGYLKVRLSSLRNGRLYDAFNNPIVARFLVRRESYAGGLEVKAFIWSYGYDGKNAVKASPTYGNLGLPVYDQAEVDALEGFGEKDGDDLVNW